MNTAIVPIITGEIILPGGEEFKPNPYLRFFNFEAARQQVMDQIKDLKSDQTPEKNTRAAYERDLTIFINFLKSRLDLPSPANIIAYKAHLRGRGCGARTVARYLTTARHFCNALASQRTPYEEIGSMAEFMGIDEAKELIRAAVQIKNPKPDESTDEADLDAYGTRLSVDEINQILGSLNRDTLQGKRDYALMLTGFLTGLRISEITRIALKSLSQKSTDTWIVKVRGKGSKVTPVAIPSLAVRAIQLWVDAYNQAVQSQLELPLPKKLKKGLIDPDTPVWMPLTTRGNIFKSPATPMGRWGTGRAIRRVSEKAGIAIDPHDLRRTWAALARDLEMEMDIIQHQLRHQSLDMTQKYVGKKRKYDEQNLLIQLAKKGHFLAA
jgi:site-specific recombinase XerD